MSRPVYWTFQRIARMKELAGQGLSVKEIARDPLIASTPGSVQKVLQANGLSLSSIRADREVSR